MTLSLPPSVPDRERGLLAWAWGVVPCAVIKSVYEPHLRLADAGVGDDGNFAHDARMSYWNHLGACLGYYRNPWNRRGPLQDGSAAARAANYVLDRYRVPFADQGLRVRERYYAEFLSRD